MSEPKAKMRVRRSLAVLVGVTIVASGAVGCSKKDDRVDEIRGYIRATQREARAFEYRSTTPEDLFIDPVVPARDMSILGLVEDDFRFKAKVLEGGTDAFEEVVSDDTLAVRFLEPRFMTPFVNKQTSGAAAPETSVKGLSVLDALRTRRWVVDEAGAPPVTNAAPETDEIGRDPVVDAITALSYVERALTEALGVRKWSADDLSPAYFEYEDAFPKPEDGSGVSRFDLIRPNLPSPGTRSPSGETAVPSTRNFRRMAIYVKDGRIIRAIEQVDVRGKRLEKFRGYFKALLRTSDAPPEVVAQVDEFFKSTPDDKLPTQILQFLNVGLRQFGTAPILVRSMSLTFPSGGATAKVELPQGDVVRGDLGVLVLSGKGKPDDDAEGTGGEGGATDGSSTSVPPATPQPAGTG